MFTFTFVHTTHVLVVLFHEFWLFYHLNSVCGQTSALALLNEGVVVEGTHNQYIPLVSPLHKDETIIFAELRLPFSQLRRLHIVGNSLPVGAQSATCLKPLLQQVVKQSWATVKVVRKDAVSLALQPVVVQQLQHYSMGQSQICSRCVFFLTVSKFPGFHAPLVRLFGMYCRNASLRMKPIILSSIERFCEGV